MNSEIQLDPESMLNLMERDLISENPKVRSKAVQYLGSIKAGEGLLINALNDINSYVQVAAIRGLGNFELNELKNENVRLLAEGLKNHNEYIRIETIKSLTKLGVKDFINTFIELLDETNPYIVTEVLSAIRKLNIIEASDKVQVLLSHHNSFIVKEALETLVLFNYQPAKSATRDLLNKYYYAPSGKFNNIILSSLINACEKLDISDSSQTLIQIAQTKIGLRGKAVKALLKLNAKEAAPLLTTFLSDPSRKLKKNIINLIRKANYRDALPLIRPLLNDPSSFIRKASLLAIRDFNDDISIPKVKEMVFSEPTPFNRMLALDVLVSLINQESYSLLIKLLDDTNSGIRKICAEKLGELKFKIPETIEIIRFLLRDEIDLEVIEKAKETLSILENLT